jgi:hypothetical protein
VHEKLEPLAAVYEWAAMVWKAYEHIQKMASSRGVSILNATHGGQLDVFDRVDYGSLFGR